MSSSPNNTSGKMSSLRHKLHWMTIRKKMRIYFWTNLLFILLSVSIFSIGVEVGKLGHVVPGTHRVTVSAEAWDELVDSHQKGRLTVDEVKDFFAVFRYEVYEKNALVLSVGISEVLMFVAGGLVVLWSLQLTTLLISSPFENGRIRRILRPIDDLALQAENLSKLDFSDDKYLLIEKTLDNMSVDEEQRLSFGDEDLMGVEVAFNNLLTRIRENNKQQARFVNDASHELRTPIAVIQGYANMLARWGREDEQVLDESITAIQNESERMKQLVEQLLFLARGDAGRMQIEMKEISLNRLMQEVYEESLMIDEDHVYRYSHPDADICVTADEGLLKQAIRILTDNAAKYTEKKDDILLSVGYTDDRHPYVQVQDTGIGMEKADVEHMFERFYRADTARTYNGTGLGLSIAKWIVDKHKGHFEIVSRTGLGTRIRIVL